MADDPKLGHRSNATRLETSAERGARARRMEAAIRRFLPPNLKRPKSLRDGRTPGADRMMFLLAKPWNHHNDPEAPFLPNVRGVRVLGRALPYESRCRECGATAEQFYRGDEIYHRCTTCKHEWTHRMKWVARDEGLPE
jgi:hypothetical protein